jgi:predicted peroxiredoxin
MTAPPRWVVLVRRGDPSELYDLAAMTASATSLGTEVFLVWFGDGLAAFAGGRLEEAGASGTSAAVLLAQARETGRLRHLACSASAVASPLGPAQVRERVDDVVGWPTVIGLMRAAEKALIW